MDLVSYYTQRDEKLAKFAPCQIVIKSIGWAVFPQLCSCPLVYHLGLHDRLGVGLDLARSGLLARSVPRSRSTISINMIIFVTIFLDFIH